MNIGLEQHKLCTRVMIGSAPTGARTSSPMLTGTASPLSRGLTCCGTAPATRLGLRAARHRPVDREPDRILDRRNPLDHGLARGGVHLPRRCHGLAILFSAALLIILNGSPGWQAIPLLTSDTTQVLWWSTSAWRQGSRRPGGIAANLVYLAYDPPWLKSLGDLATTGIGLAAAIRIWQVFPFDVSSGWSTAVRVLLIVAIAGSCIALVVQIVTLARWLADHTPHGGRMANGH